MVDCERDPESMVPVRSIIDVSDRLFKTFPNSQSTLADIDPSVRAALEAEGVTRYTWMGVCVGDSTKEASLHVERLIYGNGNSTLRVSGGHVGAEEVDKDQDPQKDNKLPQTWKIAIDENTETVQTNPDEPDSINLAYGGPIAPENWNCIADYMRRFTGENSS